MTVPEDRKNKLANSGIYSANYLCATEQQTGRSRVRFPIVSLENFFIDIKSFRSHYGPGVDSASNRNEYQEHFLKVKAAGAYG